MTGRRRGHGEGSIYRRSDGRWVAVLDLGWRGGKRSRKYFYGRTREQVARKLARALARQQQGYRWFVEIGIDFGGPVPAAIRRQEPPRR